MISLLDQQTIRKTCGEAAMSRGRGYFEAGKVLETAVSQNADSLLVHGTVSGSGGRVYEQAIAIAGLNDKRLAIHGLCSCPMMQNCKHVAATLIYLLETQEPDNTALRQRKIDSWMDLLEQASYRRTSSATGHHEEPLGNCLIYVLSLESNRNIRRLTLITQKVRILKRGGFGKPTAFPLEKINFGYTDEFIQPVDKEIARLLVSPKIYYYYNENSNWYSLEGEFGELALRKILASNRCYWQTVDTPPLTFGQPREIEFTWEDGEDCRRLVPRIEPPVKQWIRLDLLWYIDSNMPEIGILSHDYLSPDQTTALMNAPPIPSDCLEEVSRRLLIDMPEYRLELPVKLDMDERTIRDEPPVPCLCLKSREHSAFSVELGRMHFAQLRFGYGPVKLEDYAGQDLVRLVRGNIVYTIHRSVENESEIINELGARGLRLTGDQYAQSFPRLEWFFSAESSAGSASMWHNFLESDVPRLREQGWQIDIDETFLLRFEEVDNWHAELDEKEGSDWFSLALGVELDGQTLNLLPVLVDLLSQYGDPQMLMEALDRQAHFWVSPQSHQWLKIPSDRLAPIFETLIELYDHEALDEFGNLNLSRHQGVQIGDLLNDPSIRWHGADELRELSLRLRDFNGIEPVCAPEGFNTELRPYQLQGLSWMQFLQAFGFSGILADDMGLGKTVQALAHLLLEKQLGRMKSPSLVIAPTSLMGNWRREAGRFAPGLRSLVLHGTDRHGHFDKIAEHDLVFTTYPLLRRDHEHLLKHRFHYIVLDESQAIKNPKSQTSRIVYELKCNHKLCLTGTPMENHLGELWSMFHFLMPGFLGSLERFNRLFRNPVEKHGDGVRQLQLAKRVAPFLLRRTKAEVAAELPEKTEIIRSVTLEGKQRDLYEAIRLAMDKKVRDEISKKGLARSHIMILDALLKLRQICCDPRLLSLAEAKKVQKSAKMDLLMEILPEMVEEGRRILLFSQFVKMLELIEPELKKRRIGYSKLTGQTRNRDQAIDAFQNGETAVFLISLKAGGVGLNLTAADTVIHYDPWWNPAVENQATDRAHRIGQEKAVFVYKLVTEETVEEKILSLQQKKQALADAVYSTKRGDSAGSFSAEELTDLLKPLE